MAIRSVVELPRELESEIGKSATAIRRWVLNLTDNNLSAPTLELDYVRAVVSPDLAWGKQHPTLPYLYFRKVAIAENYENDPYKCLVTAEYGLVRPEEVIPPRDRPAVWSSESGSMEVPTFYYYSGSGNSNVLPLTNSAYDWFQGLTTSEAIIKFRVVKNFGIPPNQISPGIGSVFPYAQAGAINHLNNGDYGGSAAHTFKLTACNITYNIESFAGENHQYWQMTAELVFRQTGWNLQLPDVGYNFLSGGQKRRAMVFDFENAEWVASPSVVGLNGYGGQTGGAPAILVRRVLPEANFTSLFGAMPS